MTKLNSNSPAEQIAVAALSPTLNNQIHALTKDDNSKLTNILAHAVLGAIEAKAAGVNGASGAIAAAGAEIIAHTLAEQLYGVDGKRRQNQDNRRPNPGGKTKYSHIKPNWQCYRRRNDRR